MLDDNIELAPHRRSFKQGCHVQTTHHHNHGDGEKINLPNPPRSSYEKKSGRLTGRAANLRRSMEKDYNDGFYDKSAKYKDNRYRDDKNERGFFDRDRYNNRDHRDDYRDYKKDKRENERSGGYVRERHNSHRNRHDSDSNYREKEKHHDTEAVPRDQDKLPEWMTDGPTSQLDTMELTGFQDIEEEKKAYAKRKKKVRISPDVVTQKVKAEEEKVEDKPKIEKKPSTAEKRKSPAEVEVKQEDSSRQVEGDGPKSSFDINEFFNEVDYYPPHMFHEDVTKSDGVRSRFTQWFQTQASRSSSRSGSVISNISRPGSAGLIPDEVITGVSQPPSKSPSAMTPYFTPIQPAPALVAAAANAHVIQTSNILNIIQKSKVTEAEVPKTEIKGRITLDELEEQRKKDEIQNKVVNQQSDPAPAHDMTSQSAFEMLVQSMKKAGQLPDKPSPVVTGLPDHLLPKPPTRSSPAFQKLKRYLSRSPSPVEFMKGVSTISSIIASNPTIDGEINSIKRPPLPPETIKPMAPSEFFNQTTESSILKTPFSNQKPTSFFMQTPVQGGSFNNSTTEHAAEEPSLNMSVDAEQKKIPKGFLPTSVLKKMHNEKRASPVPANQPDVSMVEIQKTSSYPDLLSETMRAAKVSQDVNSNMERLASDYNQLNVTPDRSMKYLHNPDESLPFHSAPPTPRQNMYPLTAMAQHSVSAPGTPEHRLHTDPPHVQRLSAFTSPRGKESRLIAPSAFQTIKTDIGVIGSGKPNVEVELKTASQLVRNEQTRSLPNNLDQRLAPGSGLIRSNLSNNSVNPNLAPGHPLKSHMQSTPLSKQQGPQQPLSQQQQLLEAQRLAQIHQAQLLQQQKLQQIANEANQKLLQQQKQNGVTGGVGGVRPLLPDPETSTLPQTQATRGEPQSRSYQQQQHQQIQAFYQQQQQRLPQNNLTNKPFPPQGQVPPGVPQVPLPMQQQAHQQSFNQIHNLNRPRGMQNVNLAAQALVRQQLFNQAARARFIAQAQLLQQQPQVMQAALMAQAALVRGQVQAQAAYMLNHMNMRQQGPGSNNAKLPTAMLPNNKSDANMSSGATGNPIGGGDNFLSKWFDKDVLQQIPQKGTTHIPPSGKVLSVEELENKPR